MRDSTIAAVSRGACVLLLSAVPLTSCMIGDGQVMRQTGSHFIDEGYDEPFGVQLLWDASHPWLIYDSVRSRVPMDPPKRVRKLIEQYDYYLKEPQGFQIGKLPDVVRVDRAAAYRTVKREFWDDKSIDMVLRVEVMRPSSNTAIWCFFRAEMCDVITVYRGAAQGNDEATQTHVTINSRDLRELVNRHLAARSRVRTDTLNSTVWRADPTFIVSIWTPKIFWEYIAAAPSRGATLEYGIGGVEYERDESLALITDFLGKVSSAIDAVAARP